MFKEIGGNCSANFSKHVNTLWEKKQSLYVKNRWYIEQWLALKGHLGRAKRKLHLCDAEIWRILFLEYDAVWSPEHTSISFMFAFWYLYCTEPSPLLLITVSVTVAEYPPLHLSHRHCRFPCLFISCRGEGPRDRRLCVFATILCLSDYLEAAASWVDCPQYIVH